MNLTGNLTGIDSIIGADSRSVRIGDAGAPGTAGANDDLFVSGILEVDGRIYADNGLATNGVFYMSGQLITSNSPLTDGSLLMKTTTQTVEAPFFTTGSTANYILIGEHADFLTTDFGHAQQADPTLIIQSSSNISTDDEWLSLSYSNETNMAVIQAGAGNIMLNGSNYTIIGSGSSSSQSLVSNDDLFVTGKFEVDGVSFFDGFSIFEAGLRTNDNDELRFGDSNDAAIYFNTFQSSDTLFMGLNGQSNSLLITEYSDRFIDFAHTTSANPTLFIQSNGNTSLDEWIGLTYINNTNSGVISVGNGSIILNGTNYTQIGDDGSSTHSLTSGNDLFVNGKLEVDGILYSDESIVLSTDKQVWANSNNFGTLIPYDSRQTPDTMFFGTGLLTNSILIAGIADGVTDFAHPLQSNPTLFIQSEDETNIDEWLGFTYINNTNSGVISTGTGGIVLNGTNYTQIGDDGSSNRGLVSGNDLFVNGKLEVDGATYIDSSLAVGSSLTVTQSLFLSSAAATSSSIYSAAYNQNLWQLGSTHGRQLVLGASDQSAVDYDHPVQLNPTLFIHSNAGPVIENTYWGGMSFFNSSEDTGHYFEISTGNGSLLLSPADKLVNVSGNITADNVFIPSILFAHTKAAQAVTAGGLWINVSFNDSATEITRRIQHTFDDETNDSFTIDDAGDFMIQFDIDVEDTAGAPSANVVARVWLVGFGEIEGSLMEVDTTKQNADIEISHHLISRLSAGAVIKLQLTSDDTTVKVVSGATFGDHPDSATISIARVA